MIQEKQTKTDVSLIENKICLPMDKLPRVTMDEELTKLLMSLLLSGKIEIQEKEKPFLYLLIEKRVKASFTFTVSDSRLILFLCALSGTPGSAVLYLWYLQYWCFQRGVKDLNLEFFCSHIFPHGFFSKKDLKHIWDNQKVQCERTTRNLVDISFCGSSLLYSKEVYDTGINK